MAWCQKCKMEYREGITICADCGAELVEELTEEVLMSVLGAMKTEDSANRLMEFLSYSNIETAVCELDEENKLWTVSVTQKEEKKAKKLFHAFYQVEQENKENAKTTLDDSEATEGLDESEEETETEEEVFEFEDAAVADESTEDKILDSSVEESEEDVREKTMKLRTIGSNTYVKKADQYTDLKFTAITFLLFAVIGFSVILLNVFTEINFLGTTLSLVIMSGMVIGFFIVGISSWKKSGEVKNQIGEENNLTQEINQFLKDTITEELLMEHHDKSLSDELNYLNKTEYIKELIMNHYGDLDDSYADQLIEEFYNDTFELDMPLSEEEE